LSSWFREKEGRNRDCGRLSVGGKKNKEGESPGGRRKKVGGKEVFPGSIDRGGVDGAVQNKSITTQ